MRVSGLQGGRLRGGWRQGGDLQQRLAQAVRVAASGSPGPVAECHGDAVAVDVDRVQDGGVGQELAEQVWFQWSVADLLGQLVGGAERCAERHEDLDLHAARHALPQGATAAARPAVVGRSAGAGRPAVAGGGCRVSRGVVQGQGVAAGEQDDERVEPAFAGAALVVRSDGPGAAGDGVQAGVRVRAGDPERGDVDQAVVAPPVVDVTGVLGLATASHGGVRVRGDDQRAQALGQPGGRAAHAAPGVGAQPGDQQRPHLLPQRRAERQELLDDGAGLLQGEQSVLERAQPAGQGGEQLGLVQQPFGAGL